MVIHTVFINVKRVTHGPGPMFASKKKSLKVGGRQRKRKIICSSSRKRPIKLSPEYLYRLSPQSQSGSKRINGEVMFFFSVGEAATSKWTHGEVAVFGSLCA